MMEQEEEKVSQVPQMPQKRQPVIPPKQEGPLDVDAMVIPTMGANPGANQMSEYPDGEEQPTFDPNALEPLSNEDHKNYQPLVEEFGEPLVQKLCSKTWQQRDEAIGELMEELIDSKRHGEEEGFVNGCGAVKITIVDKMAGVSQKAMNLLASLCETYTRVNLSGRLKTQFAGYSDIIVGTLSEKLGDNL